MTVITNAVAVPLGLSSNPLIEGAPSSSYGSAGNGVGFNNPTPSIGRRGCRVALLETTDFTTHSHVGFGMYTTAWNIPSFVSTVALGGIRVVFVDSSGNYAGFNIHGSDLPNYEDSNTGRGNGFFVSYSDIGSPADRPISWQIDRTSPPAISGGVINWSQISAIEITINKISSQTENLYIGNIRKISDIVVTESCSLPSIFSGVTSSAIILGDLQHWVEGSYISQAASVRVFAAKMGFSIGNGVTQTNFSSSGIALGFFNTHENSPTYRSVGPLLLLGSNKTRALKINQSALDTFSLTDCTIASASNWQWELSGTGTCTVTRVQFWRFDGFKAAHGHYIDCMWNDPDKPIEVTNSTVISGGSLRGAKSTAIKIIGTAGSYTNVQIKIDSPSTTYDIELGAGGAGTYDLSGISVPDGYMLRVRNNSAVNGVVVKISLGIAYSTSTAGGAIAVELPAISVDITAPALISGSRIQLYNVTDGTEMLNTVLASTGLSQTIAYAGNKVIRLRADHASKLPLETAGVLTASGLTFLDVQADDTVYLDNGIDGSTVTEFIPDEANIQVDINDPDGVTDVQRLYAWLQWYMTTEAGIRSNFFGSVSAIDSANYQIDQTKANIKLDNISAMPVRVVGGNLTRRDGTTVIAAASGSIQMDPGKAYAIETGVSGLTSEESAKLNQISLLSLESTTQAAAESAALAASRSESILALPSPSSSEIATTVWSNAKVDTLALQTTALDAANNAATSVSNTETLLLKPSPSETEISNAVWNSSSVLNLADKSTLDLVAIDVSKARKLASNKVVVSNEGQLVTIYDDDKTSTLLQFNVTEDKMERTPL